MVRWIIIIAVMTWWVLPKYIRLVTHAILLMRRRRMMENTTSMMKQRSGSLVMWWRTAETHRR
jgi:hypothetical protein